MANKKLSAIITIGGAVSSTLGAAFGAVRGETTKVGAAIEQLTRRQRELNNIISTVGRNGAQDAGLRLQYANQELSAINRQIAALRRRQAIEKAQSANLAKRAEYRGQIGDAFALGATAVAPVVMAAKFETAMLGVAKQVEGARDAGGRLTPVYFEMGKAIQKLGREVPLATNEIADMVTAGARMGIARDQLIGFTRTAAMMADAFELPAGELADSMGKIAGLYKIPIPAIGELADAVNFLDDNAISKGGDIIDFLTRTGGVAGSVKITGKEMAALGSTLLTLGERTETAGTATNAMFSKLAAATKGSKKFRSAMNEIGISLEEVEKGMQVDAVGTMMKVLDAVGKLDAEKQMGVMVELVGMEHADTMAKLANNTGEFRRQLSLANSEAAKGSMSREFAARLQTTNAQWQIMKNRAMEVAVNFGSVLLPAINSVFSAVGPVITAVADFARENPKLTQAVVGTAVALMTLKVATLAGGYAFTFITGGALQVVSILTRFPAIVSMAVTVVRGLGTALMFAGKGVLWLGRALLMNPIGLAVTAIAGAVFLIYKNWEPLKGWFSSLWQDIAGTFNRHIDWVVSKIDWVAGKWRATKEFFGFGDEAPKATGSAPAVPPTPRLATGRGAGGGQYTDSSQNTFQIVQQPGENPRDLARRIAEEQERQRRIKQRGIMLDGVMAQ